MAVALQECVAIFITALYNLCKNYLGNRPFNLDNWENEENKLRKDWKEQSEWLLMLTN